MTDDKGSRVKRARKLLVASVGVASVNFAASACDGSDGTVVVANLLAIPIAGGGGAGTQGKAGEPAVIPLGGRDGSSGAAGAGEGGTPEGGSAGRA